MAVQRNTDPVGEMPGGLPGGLQVELRQTAPIALNVSLQCAAGELLALSGPSGSGKTTVLRAIAGLQRVTHARIDCAGVTWCDTATGRWQSPQRRRAGLVFQHYALFPHLSALGNVTAAMSHVPAGQREARARDWLRMTNMEGLEARRPRALSGGQRQRVALARALAREPAVLLLDEPFSAVDQQTRERLFRELVQLRRRLRHPVILVTHDMQEVQQLADTLCLIHRGKTLQSGPVTGVMQSPDSAEIARLLGHRNLYIGNVSETGNGASSAGSTVRPTGRLRVLGRTLEAATGAHGVGQAVDVLIAPSAVVLHRQGRPSRGERENPLDGIVAEITPLGDDLWLRLETAPTGESLHFKVSRHVAARNAVERGGRVRVSVLAEGLHLMAR